MTNDDTTSRATRDELARELLPPLPKTQQFREAPEDQSRPWRGYRPEEWALLEHFPLLVAVYVSLVDESGHRGTEKEERAIEGAYVDLVGRYPNNPIIQRVVGMARQALPLAERARQLSEQQTLDELRDELMRAAPQVVTLLKRAPSSQIGEEYKRFVLAVGEAVAYAAKEGGFPRFASVEVSEWERRTIQWVGEALRMENLPGDWEIFGIEAWQRGF